MDQVIKIDINLVFTIINLLVLYLLMKKFLFGPIINVMDQRKAMIDQQFAEAKERQDNAKALQEQYEGALKSAKEESYQIMEQARKEAKAQADHTVEETTAKVDAMLAKAQEDIRMERENAMRQMKGDVAELAMKAAAKIIGKDSGADQDLSLPHSGTTYLPHSKADKQQVQSPDFSTLRDLHPLRPSTIVTVHHA
ncbi:MAG: ATP synthase F0 subunit B [Blautia obeum]|nr:ATP synthase F0 subunit B [Blautia obeum]